MKISIQSILLVIMVIHSSVHGMKKIKVPKSAATRFLGINAKNFEVNPEYQEAGDSFLSKDVVIDQPVNVKVPSKPQQPKIPSGIKMKKMPSSAWEGAKRSYSTLGNTPFKKDFGLLSVKTEQAKEDLQKRGYSTTTDARKIDFLEKIKRDVKQDKTSLLKDDLVLKRLGKFMSPKSMQQFIGESIALSAAKKLLINEAKEKCIYIPVDASEEVRLAYGGGIENIRAFFKDSRYQPFIPMIDRALVEENKALEQGRPVLYHGLKKDYYKYMYFCTKIMELKELFYPGFLMLRGPEKDYIPQEKSSTIRKSFIKRGSQNDLRNIKDRYHLLSTTNSLFVNFERGIDTHPLDLIVRDASASDLLVDQGVSKINIDLENFCKKHQLENYYTKIWNLFRSTDIKSDGGILLQCIFNKDLFDKTVYASMVGGYKRENSSEVIKSMPSVVMLDNEILRRLQFRMILTDDYLLNPANPEVRKGFKVKVYTQDQKALYEFQEKVDDFFDSIKKELMQKKKKGKLQQKTKTWGEYFRNFLTGR